MRFYFLAFLILCSCSSKPLPKLAICAIFKDEAPWLKEWIEYHHEKLGVFRFYLYNNDSTDEHEKVLSPFIEKGLVELIDWSSKDPSHLLEAEFMDAPHVPAQIGAYNHCLKTKALSGADWVALIDIDEFIVPLSGQKAFYQLLQKAKKQNKGSLSFQWRIFGTSQVESLKEGEKLTHRLTRRAKEDHPWHTQVKTIYQPQAVDFCLVHVPKKLKEGFGGKTISANQVRIHHYWTRTEKFCKEKRGALSQNFLEELNQQEDLAILSLF